MRSSHRWLEPGRVAPGLLAMAYLLAASPAAADGALFSQRDAHLSEPSQKAVVCWDGTTETLLLSSRLQSPDLDALSKAAWVVPVASSRKPEVTTASIEAFEVLADFLSESTFFAPPTVGAAAMTGVTVHEAKKLDIYDVAVLEATSADALVQWLHQNGFNVPAAAGAVLRDCVAGGVRWFVANKIDLSNTFGPNFERARGLIRSLTGDGPKAASLLPRLERVRAEVIAAVLQGTAFADSPCGTSPGKSLRLLDRAAYDRLLADCRLAPDVYEKLGRFERWAVTLMGDTGYGNARDGLTYHRPLVVRLHQDGWRKYDHEVLEVGLPLSLRQWLAGRGETEDSYRAFLETHLPDIADTYRTIATSLNLHNCGRLLEVERQVEELADGVATPLAITFTPVRPTFPLQLSRINEGRSLIEVCVVAPHPVRDENGMLAVDESRLMPYRVSRDLAPFLAVPAGRHVTRLAYQGPLSRLSKDAVFVDGPPKSNPFTRAVGAVSTLPGRDAPDVRAFVDVFARDRPEHGRLRANHAAVVRQRTALSAESFLSGDRRDLDQLWKLEAQGRDLREALQDSVAADLATFIKEQPTSRFADDALMILLSRLCSFVESAMELNRGSPRATLELYRTVAGSTFAVEPFALLEYPGLAGPHHFASLGLGHAYAMGTLSVALTLARTEPAEAARLAEASLNAFDRPAMGAKAARDPAVQALARCLHEGGPTEFFFAKSFAEGAEALNAERLGDAERILLASLARRAAALSPAPDDSSRVASAWFLVGEARFLLKKFAAAREAYQRMLDLSPSSLETVRLSGDALILVSPHVARARMAACFLREGNPRTALALGKKAIAELQANLSGDTEALAGAHYTVASACALTGDAAGALAHLATARDESDTYATTAADDDAFASLRDDQRFKVLLQGKR